MQTEVPKSEIPVQLDWNPKWNQTVDSKLKSGNSD
jgi:hypothetical protein